MLTQARHSMIQEYVDQRGLCRVAELCELTNSSESTIRRDLIQMEEDGIIRRVHGGAQSIKNFSHDVSQHVRFSLNHEAKVAIAKYAVENHVHANDNIFIDAGTTTYEMVQFLANIPGLTVVTNGMETALASLNHGIKTILLGGTVKTDTHAVVGQTAMQQIKAMNFSASFIGANGIDAQGFLTTPDVEEAAIKRAELVQANQAYVLTDASKIGERSFAIFGNASDTVVVCNQLTLRQKRVLPEKILLEEVTE